MEQPVKPAFSLALLSSFTDVVATTGMRSGFTHAIPPSLIATNLTYQNEGVTNAYMD